jgi:hypothetical protein
MAVSSSLALQAPSVKFSPGLDCGEQSPGSRMKFAFEELNGALTFVSEKVHLDEIAVMMKHSHQRSGLMPLAGAGLIACRSLMAPI